MMAGCTFTPTFAPNRFWKRSRIVLVKWAIVEAGQPQDMQENGFVNNALWNSDSRIANSNGIPVLRVMKC